MLDPDEYNRQAAMAEGRGQAMPAVQNLLKRLDEMRADRDEWKTQHENLLAMYNALVAEIATLRHKVDPRGM